MTTQTSPERGRGRAGLVLGLLVAAGAAAVAYFVFLPRPAGESPGPAEPPMTPFPMFNHAKPRVGGARPGAKGGAADPLGKAVSDRFGTPVVLFDYNRDGKPDVLIPRGMGFDLYRNDGNSAFALLTPFVAPDDQSGRFGAAVGDFDNDGWPDVAVTGPRGIRLYRNMEGKHFADVTADAGLDKLTGVCLGVAWVDLDQDGYLDLVVANYAQTSEQAVKLLTGETLDGGGSLVAFANTGGAGATRKFQRLTWPDDLKLTGPVVNVFASDIDDDGRVDLGVCVDGLNVVTVLNDGAMKFHIPGAGRPKDAVPKNGGLVIDATGSGRSDYFVVQHGRPPVLSFGKPAADGGTLGTTDSQPLLQAHRCDIDQDGRADVVGVGADGKPVILRGDGKGQFTVVPRAFGPDADRLAGPSGLAVGDLDGDGEPDVFVIAADGPHLFRGGGNGNVGLRLTLTGRRDAAAGLNTNADGIGAKLSLRAGPYHPSAERTTLAAGLGQSLVPLHLGIGREAAAESIRVRWPDGLVQEVTNRQPGAVEVVQAKP
jgi:hypothetical protein